MPDRRGFFASPKPSQRPGRPVHRKVSRGLRLHWRWPMRQLRVRFDQMAPSFWYRLRPTAPKVRRSPLVPYEARSVSCRERWFVDAFTRERLALEADTSLDSDSLTRILHG